MVEPSKAEYQTPRALMHKAGRAMANWVLATAIVTTKIKAMMTIFPRELWEPQIKAPDCPGPSLTAFNTCSLAELDCPFLRRQSQLEEESDITGLGETKVIWAAQLQMQQEPAEGRWGCKKEGQGTEKPSIPWSCSVGTRADFLCCMAPLWQIFGKGKSIKGGCAGDGHCLYQSSEGNNNRKWVWYLWHQAEG